MGEIVLAKDITLCKVGCLEAMSFLPKPSIDLVLYDPLFGVIAPQRDKIIPFPEMRREIGGVGKKNVSTVSFGNKPFSSFLRCGNLKEFKYDRVWEESKASNFLLAKKQPLKAHELMSVFGKGRIPYYPIMEGGEPYENRTRRGSSWTGINNVPSPAFRNENKGTRYPRSVVYFKTAESENKTIYVNQKPIALLQYLIGIYTKKGDTILDFASGNTSTTVACIYTYRKCICIEKDETHFSQGEKQVRGEYQYLRL